MRLFVIVFFLTALNCKTTPEGDEKCDHVYQVVDQMPTYKTGQTDLLDAVRKFRLSGNCGLEQLRQITWVLNAKGKVIGVEVLGPKGACIKEIAKQAEQLSPWTPGKLKGNPVCVRVVLPINISGRLIWRNS